MMDQELFKLFIFIYIAFSYFLGILLFIYQFFVVPNVSHILSSINESYYNLTQQINSINISPTQKALLLNNVKELYQIVYTEYDQTKPIPLDEFIIYELILIVLPLIIYNLVFGKSNESERKNHNE